MLKEKLTKNLKEYYLTCGYNYKQDALYNSEIASFLNEYGIFDGDYNDATCDILITDYIVKNGVKITYIVSWQGYCDETIEKMEFKDIINKTIEYIEIKNKILKAIA